MQRGFQSIKKWIIGHKKLVIILVLLGFLALLLLLAAYLYIGSYKKYILTQPAAKAKHIPVGIVFGSGITKSGKPYKELQGRLDGAAELLQNGTVGKLVLSGDNRFKNYNEPLAMVDYLVHKKHIDPSKLQPDFAGRSTYETCERAHKVFGLTSALLISAPSHLPRAIYTCRQFGVESFGLAFGNDANNAFRREFLARNKAIFNIYVIGENTVLGPPIKI